MKSTLLSFALAALIPFTVLAQSAPPAAVPAAPPAPDAAPVVPDAPAPPAAPLLPGEQVVNDLNTLGTQVKGIQSAVTDVEANVKPVQESIKKLYTIGESYPQQVHDFKAKYDIPEQNATTGQEVEGVSRALLEKAGLDVKQANTVNKAFEGAAQTAKAFDPLKPQNIMLSVGITAGMSVLGQLASTGQVDLKSSMSFLGDKGFWGGLVGSGVGYGLAGLAVRAFLPPGFGGVVAAFLPTFAGMTGAYLGGELGTSLVKGGTKLTDALKNLSIAEIVAEAAGSTVGMFVGANLMTSLAAGMGSFAGPLGSIVGGMIGATMGRWAVRTVKNMISGNGNAASLAGDPSAAPASSQIAPGPGLPGAAIMPADTLKSLQDSYRAEYVQYVQAEQSGDKNASSAALSKLNETKKQYELSVRTLMSSMATPGHAAAGH